MCGYYTWVSGGLHIDGSQESPVVEMEVVRQCKVIRERGIKSIVIAGVYSPIDTNFRQEDYVRSIVQRELGDVDIVCSHEVSNIGFLERENAAILNASIVRFARRTVRGFRAVMKRLNLDCGLFLTQNDGTLVDAVSAARLPIRTFSSGATNSMRGAAYLGGLDVERSGQRTSTLVIDIGGTTSDIGMLLPSGFPRQASAYVTVAGVRVNYSVPHLESIGLGGGSIVRVNEEQDQVTVGPDSVGYMITKVSRIFGGHTLTATDITLATHKSFKIGDYKLVENVFPSVSFRAEEKIKSMLENLVDIMKTSANPLPLLLVGGGSIIAPDEIEGVSQIIRPPFHDVANAVGAAIAKVGGIVDHMKDISAQTVEEATEDAKRFAIQKAIDAGARPSTASVVEVDVIPIQYMANQVRVIVKAVGELDISKFSKKLEDWPVDMKGENFAAEIEKTSFYKEVSTVAIDIDAYTPKVANQEWQISEIDVKWMADGCYVLGCAGGGSPQSVSVQLRDQIRDGHVMRVIDAATPKDEDCIFWGGHMGSPAVSVERLAGNETIDAIGDLLKYLRRDTFDAVMGLEIGGGNGLQALLVGSTKHFDRPVVDADWMGRAYPTYWQTTICVYAPGQLTPAAIASGDGKSLIMTKTTNDEIVDRVLRAACAEMGSRVGMAANPTTPKRVRKYGVLNTISLAWRIGRCIARAHANNTISRVTESLIDEVGGKSSAKKLFVGKIVSVDRSLHKGHSYGEITIQPLQFEEEEEDTKYDAVANGGTLKIPFKNENIFAKHISPDGREEVRM